MFRSKKNKEYDVRLTEKQVRELTQNMSVRSKRSPRNARDRQKLTDNGRR